MEERGMARRRFAGRPTYPEDDFGEDVRPGGFKSPTPESINKKMGEIEKRRKKLWTPKEGPNVIRILPGRNGFYQEVPSHFVAGRSLTCRKFVNKRCPACEAVEKWSASDNPAKQKKAADMELQYRVYFNIIDINEPKKGVQPYATSDRMLYKILAFYNDPDYGNFTDPEKGFDLMIRREGQGLRTKYPEIRFRRNPSPVGYKKWKSELHDLGKFAEIVSLGEMESLLTKSKEDAYEEEE